MKKTAVVILNYNNKHFLEKFLKTTIELSPEADIVLIDNNSTDGSQEYVAKNFSSVQLIKLDKNYGFTGGYNLGLKDLSHDYFVLLNSDVEVTKNWLNPFTEMALRNRNIAAIQPKILEYANRSNFEYAGAAGGFLDIIGYPFCRGRIFVTTEEDKEQYNKETEIFWASGACFFVRAEVFKTLKGFDNKFFAHMEEIDLCWRMHNAGFTVAYTPKSTVYHVGGGTLPTSSPFKTYLNFRNNLAMLFKNLPLNQLFPILLMRMALDGISGFRYLLQGSPKNFWAVLKAHFVFYSWIPYLIKNRSASNLGFRKLYSKSIVWQYFVKKKTTYKEICSE